MPFRPSRYTTDRELAAIVDAEDSNDDDYDDHERRTKPRQKPRARGGSAVPRKKSKKNRYGGSDISDDDDELSEEAEDWTDEDVKEEVEFNEATGRPKRRAAKPARTYKESDEEEADDYSLPSEEEAPVTPSKPRAIGPKSKIVTLKIRTPLPRSPRILRDRRPSVLAARAEPSGTTRRTRRMSEEEGETLIELSNSGRHTVLVRAGSRDPDIPQSRATRGSKSIMYPSKSTIDEVDEPQSVPKEQEEIVIPPSQETVQFFASQDELPDMVPHIGSDLHASVLKEPVPLLPSDDPLHGSPHVESIRPEIEPLSEEGEAEGAEEDDEGPVSNRGRTTRASQKRKADSPAPDEPMPSRRRLRPRESASRAHSSTRHHKDIDKTSDFDPEAEADEAGDVSMSEESDGSPQKRTRQRVDADEDSNGGRRSTRLQKKNASQQASASDEDYELQEEIAELQKDDRATKRRRRAQEELVFESRGKRNTTRKDYNLMRNIPQLDDDDETAVPTLSQKAKKTGGGQSYYTMHDYAGPFGGVRGRPLLGGPQRAPDADTDSSDDEIMKQPKQIAGVAGMTPTTATNPFNPFAMNALISDPAQGPTGTPANLGKVKDKQALADADPLGVDQNIDFDSVGGLQGHIDQLKEMVALPLLYPEIFLRFKITPPRGVLFHGPPGTGKTLLARALASSVSSQGRKVTFYMRKGADALSKWVGEAERQLRLLFEEARKNQPSIIFFDEIDGLAPVRSSKQEQIHASIVSTLLALMDGMDGRGQVIVIGATNRPDSIDPALRRPGRFDREFYFPLPDKDARRSIINIHTRGWDPPLDDHIKDELATLTKGYGGADLRALCTEAALNAVQRRYPQIYSSKEKLLIDPKSITVTPKDFMISIKKMTPSSERSASSGAAPLPQNVEPLLRRQLKDLEVRIEEMLPRQKKTTALEEAMYEDVADGRGFGRERMQQAFESSRVFRPRLLVHGRLGMGQQYIAAALLNHFQGVHVQSLDLSILLGDTTSSPEATVIRLFAEAKMHKPSVIYIPNVQEWFGTVGQTVLTTFHGLLRSIKPTDPILVLAFLEAEPDDEDEGMKREFFGYSHRNQYRLASPSHKERSEFFRPLKDYIKTRPSDFPDPTHRKRRQMEILPPAPAEPEKEAPPPTKEELKAQKKRDRMTLNVLKQRLQPIMDQIRTKYRRFRTGIIEDHLISYLYKEADLETVTSDVHDNNQVQETRPYRLAKDPHGVGGLVDIDGIFFYNLDAVTIEKRLSNGYYKRPKDFLTDIKRLAKDAKAAKDEDRMFKANELQSNVEVDIANIEMLEPQLVAECEKVYQRELQRLKEEEEKAQAAKEMQPPQLTAVQISDTAATTTTEGAGPITLGENFNNPKDMLVNAIVPAGSLASTDSIMTNGFHDVINNRSHDRNSNNASNATEANAGEDAHLHNSSNESGSKQRSNGETQSSESTTALSVLGRTASAQPKPFSQYSAPSQRLRQQYGLEPLPNQASFMTPMEEESQFKDYTNDASTTQTNSGQKAPSASTSGYHDPRHSYSGVGSDYHDQRNSQDTGAPDLFGWDERTTGDIPDTQDTSASQSSTNGASAGNGEPSSHFVSAASKSAYPSHDQSRLQSSFPPVPRFDAPSVAAHTHTGPAASSTSAPARAGAGLFAELTAAATPTSRLGANAPPHAMKSLLNPPSPPPTSQPQTQTQTLEYAEPNLALPDESRIDNTVLDIVDKTSGLSVEQMEQVNSVLMDILWQTRGEWNRTIVLDCITDGFNNTIADMRDTGQEFGNLSWERVDTAGERATGRRRAAIGMRAG
ncbi:TAT-binding protein-like protein 7, AAA ATPase [Lithohypha guttulata]|uniref:TAT-binding protein-like protein 7, AAA ATPase n=1 Tax=Lithohypha guttulata TaxID=1690604 RepID=A0AAN7T3T8_9EURO|nr:TAT-binding protein-like protein 7, AAA ATPase [Lithohypha guttulata]